MTNLLDSIETYLADTGMSASSFGREVMGNPNFVFDMRSGLDYRRSTAERVVAYIAANPAQTESAAQ